MTKGLKNPESDMYYAAFNKDGVIHTGVCGTNQTVTSGQPHFIASDSLDDLISQASIEGIELTSEMFEDGSSHD